MVGIEPVFIVAETWVDSQHLVRRFEMSMDVSAPTGPAMTETVKVDLGDYGSQRQPAIPPLGQVQDLSGLTSSVGG